MISTATKPAARERRRKTRTKTVSSRPPLALSSLPPNQIELFPGKEHLVCPDCETWCPLTGVHSRTPKLVPHHTKRAGTADPRRCTDGSNRLVILDLSIAEWQQRLTDAAKATACRRPTRVLRKPKTPVAPPVTHLDPAPPTADSARAAYIAHRKRCTRCTGRTHCQDGARLGSDFLRLLRREPRQSRNRELLAQVQHDLERNLARQYPRARKAAWDAVLPAVQRTDDQRAQRPAGDTPTTGPAVPQTTLRITP